MNLIAFLILTGLPTLIFASPILPVPGESLPYSFDDSDDDESEEIGNNNPTNAVTIGHVDHEPTEPVPGMHDENEKDTPTHTYTQTMAPGEVKSAEHSDEELSVKMTHDGVLKVPFSPLSNSHMHEISVVFSDDLMIKPRQVPMLPYESWAESPLSLAPK